MKQLLRIALMDSDPDVRAGRKMVISSREEFSIVLDSGGEASDVAAVANGLVDVLVIDQRLASGPGVDFYDAVRHEMGIADAPWCVITTAFEQPALLFSALEIGVNHVVAIESGPEALLRAIDQVSAGEAGVSLEQLHALIASQSLGHKLDLDFIRQVEKLPEKLASNLRRLQSVWKKSDPSQLKKFLLGNLDGLVSRLPVRTPAELVIKLEQSELLSVE